MRYLWPVAAWLGVARCVQVQQPLPVSNIPQPLIGFGTWNLKESPDNTTAAVSLAIQAGYRQIDCAAAYGNEKAVGKGIAEGLEKTGLTREEIWVTSKLWNDHHAPDRVEAGLDQTLSDLGLDYLDLYLMHWPVGKGPDEEKYHYDYVKTWKAMSKLPATGKVRTIGISNFSPAQLKHLILQTGIKPAVHQMELHPYLPQTKWIRAHQALGIGITAYSPLGNMNPTYGSRRDASSPPLLLENKVITEIAEERGCTPAQVVLLWGMARGTSVIPKSKHEAYIKENVGSLFCSLTRGDLGRIDGLGERPVRFNNPSKGWGVELFEGLEDA